MDSIAYADTFKILGSLTDMKIDFMSVSPHIGQNGQIEGEDCAMQQRIILSLPLAKDLATKLLKAVNDYEKNVGEVLNLDETKNKLASKKTNEQ